jgi:queuine/archaeosine tRNA-ribosyltransferase
VLFNQGFIFLVQSPVDGKPMLLTPEESIQIQVRILLFIFSSCSQLFNIIQSISKFFNTPSYASFTFLIVFFFFLQNRIGADIIMALDDVVKTTITGPRIEEAMYRTLRGIDRCIAGNFI